MSVATARPAWIFFALLFIGAIFIQPSRGSDTQNAKVYAIPGVQNSENSLLVFPMIFGIQVFVQISICHRCIHSIKCFGSIHTWYTMFVCHAYVVKCA